MIRKWLLFLTLFFSQNLLADEAGTKKRLDEMEKQIQSLKEKIEKMESTLTKSNGFMIVANVTCEIQTPFDGTFAATELSENAARSSVMEQCKQKIADKTHCLPQFVRCKK